MAHLLKYDSVHGKYPMLLRAVGDTLIAGDRTVKILSEKDPKRLPWEDLGVEYVIEASGVFRTRETMNLHLEAGARKVILTAPAKDDLDNTVVMGVNDDFVSNRFLAILGSNPGTCRSLARKYDAALHLLPVLSHPRCRRDQPSVGITIRVFMEKPSLMLSTLSRARVLLGFLFLLPNL
ncbi:glyceraldehyde 3-phosphate dehydrogenase N-terminal domain-containing protein [bacterium]|nr:glyceraldehyde 3-phosphate dehydrogenase N-terminal domain-containing protein [bacterium]